MLFASFRLVSELFESLGQPSLLELKLFKLSCGLGYGSVMVDPSFVGVPSELITKLGDRPRPDLDLGRGGHQLGDRRTELDNQRELGLDFATKGLPSL